MRVFVDSTWARTLSGQILLTELCQAARVDEVSVIKCTQTLHNDRLVESCWFAVFPATFGVDLSDQNMLEENRWNFTR